MFGNVYEGRKVLVTGHTGFKGSWLVFWLERLGAKVCGVALEPETEPNHFRLLKPAVRSVTADVGDAETVGKIMDAFQPEIVFHLAARAIVRESYENPLETLRTNVLGTANVLEACRKTKSVRAAVVVTSDKCYENTGRLEGYAETDPMGGFDPYSASKGCAELVAASWRNSFFPVEKYGTAHTLLLATARAGNVIGGGDWASDRLVPDAMRAAAEDEPVLLRNPSYVRPWQHVLEPLSGYLLLGEKLFEGEKTASGAWNFGPEEEGLVTVEHAAELLSRGWNAVRIEHAQDPDSPHEARILRLNCAKAREKLEWRPVWTAESAFRRTAVWYREFYTTYKLNTDSDLETYLADASEKGLSWTR